MGSKVTDPTILAQLNGRKADPETRRELNRLAKLDQTRQIARDTYAEMTPMERFGVGLARPVVETAKGIKSLFTKLSPEEQTNLERLQEVSGGAGTAGRVLGEVALFAAPGGAVTRAGRLLPRALGKAGAIAGDISAVAGMEALKAPTENRSRGQAAWEGGTGALLGAGAGGVLRRTLSGVRTTPKAAPMLAAGVPLTPGMAAGGVAQRVEQALAHVPVISGPLRQKQRAAVGAWNRRLLDDTIPDGKVSAAGSKGFTEVSKRFDDAYDKLWSKPVTINAAARSKMVQQLEAAVGQLPRESQRSVRALAKSILPSLYGDAPIAGRAISQLDDRLREAAKAAARKGNFDESRALNQLRDNLRAAMPSDVATELTRLDGKFRKFATLRKAASYKGAAEHGGVFTPSQLMSAATSGRGAGKGAVSQGRATFQQEALDALEVLGDIPAKPGIAEKLSAPIIAGGALMNLPATIAGYAGVRAAFSEPVRRAALGGTRGQEAALRLAEYLRKHGVSAARVGAALEE